MRIKKLKTKKFEKKNHFLQISLLKFLYWRDAKLNASLNEKKIPSNIPCDVDTTIEQESLLVRNVLQFFNNNLSFHNKLSTNIFFEKNNQKQVINSSILSEFFPRKQSFMYYWVLPFVGFVGLAYLNQKNQGEFYPSMELWPYLKKTVMVEKQKISPSDFVRSKESDRSLCWETLEYLNYKKLMYDHSKNYVAEIHSNEDNLCFVVKPNWREHQKNHYLVTFEDKKLADHFSNILNHEKKEIENLWKAYFYETQDFIHAQLRPKFSAQTFSKTSHLDSKTKKNNVEDKQISFLRNNMQLKSLNDGLKSNENLLETILVQNLWNRSSLRWYWYELNPQKISNLAMSKELSLLSKSAALPIKSMDSADSSKQNEKYASFLWSTEDTNFKKSFEKSWLDLDEFPKKIFPVAVNERVSKSVEEKKFTHSFHPIKTGSDSNHDDLRSKSTDILIIQNEKDLTLDLFSNLGTEPIQCYQKASLLLEQFIKKQNTTNQLDLESLMPSGNKIFSAQNASNHRQIVTHKNDDYFLSSFKENLNSLHKLSQQRRYFSAKKMHSSLLNAPRAATMNSQSRRLSLRSQSTDPGTDVLNEIENRHARTNDFLSLLSKIKILREEASFDFNSLDSSTRNDEIESIRKLIYELSVLRQFSKYLKKATHVSRVFLKNQKNNEISAVHNSKNQIQIPLSLLNSTIPKLSHETENVFVSNLLKKRKNNMYDRVKIFGWKEKNQKQIEVLKFKNPFVMSGYEFPDINGVSNLKQVVKYENKISDKHNWKDSISKIFAGAKIQDCAKAQSSEILLPVRSRASGDDQYTKLIVSLPPTFSKSIDSLLKSAMAPSLATDQQAERDRMDSATRHKSQHPNRQNSFLFQNYNDFFTVFKHNHQANLYSYWSSNTKKNQLSNEINENTLSAVAQNVARERNNKNSRSIGFLKSDQTPLGFDFRIKSRFYEYAEKSINSMFTKLNTLLKIVVRRTQLKLLDQHNFESYLTLDSVEKPSNSIKKTPFRHIDPETFSKTTHVFDSESKKFKAVDSILYFKSIRNFDILKKPFELSKCDISASAAKRIDGSSYRIFKLAKLKKCLKNSLLFKNLETRRVEKIFRTYLSCKSNEYLDMLNRDAKCRSNDSTSKLNGQKARYANAANSYYIANALRRLRIRVKHNLLISKKNNLQKLFAGSTTNTKQFSREIQSAFDVSNTLAKTANLTNIDKSDDMTISNSRSISDFLYDIKSDRFPVDGTKSRNKHLSLKLYQISPHSLLKKLGFIFLNRADASFLKNRKASMSDATILSIGSHSSNKLKKNSDLTNKTTQNLAHLEKYEHSSQKNTKRLKKQKSRQKKRRRKKQKLENRRRKKRKRFHPRPKWLRFQLYKNFMKKRHFKHNVICDFDDVKNSNRLPNAYRVKKTLSKNTSSVWSTKSNLMKDKRSPDIRRPFDYHFSEHKALNKLLKTKIYRQNKQQWGTSENPNFEKLTIKKMPLAWSLPVFANHDLYRISNALMSDFQRLCWKSYWLRSNVTPYIHRIQSSMKKIESAQIYEQSSKTLKNFLSHLLGFDSPQISPHLFNDQTTNSLVHRSINKGYNASTQTKKDTEKYIDEISNYSNRSSIFLTGRKSPRLSWYLNIKQSLQNRNVASSFSLFQNTQNAAEYNRILYERISEVIKNVKINLNVNGQNHARSFKRGRRRSEKNTKNIPNFWARLGRDISPEIRAFSPFASTLDASIKPYGDLPALRVVWALNKTNVLSFKKPNAVRNLWATRKIREQNKSNKTKKFLYNSWKKIFPENFDDYCFRKTLFVEDKIGYSGFIKKDYQNYLIRLKMRFKSLNFFDDHADRSVSRSSFFQTQHKKNRASNALDEIRLEKNFPRSKSVSSSYDMLRPQKHAKRSIFFWWVDSFDIPGMNLSCFFMQQNSSMERQSLLNFAIVSSLWICAIVFHMCSLFFVLNIPEIRSLMKFNLLLLYKLSNSYLFVIYSIYDSLKKYKNQIKRSFSLIFPRLMNDATNLPGDVRSSSLWSTHSQMGALSSRDRKHDALNYSFASQTKNLRATNPRKKIYTKPVRHVDENRFQELRYISKNGSFLETTFRVPMQLRENSIWSVLRGDARHTSFSFFENYMKTKASSDAKDRRRAKKVQLPGNILFPAGHSPINGSGNETRNGTKILDTNERNLIRNAFESYGTRAAKFQSKFSLMPLYLAKFSIVLIDGCIQLLYKTLFKIIDVLESFMLIIYKFLEKPAELIIDWIAQVFLVEWSSDILTYLPEALDSSIWSSYVKSSRSSRIVGPVGFLLQRRLWCFMEIFIDFISKPDADLAMRQQKGTIFWNIWAEILIRAAERYNINIQSLTTLKEEQELLIERMLDDENWDWCKTPTNKRENEMIPLIEVSKNRRFLATSNKREIKRGIFARQEMDRLVRFCYKGSLKNVKLTPTEREFFNTNASDIWRRWSTNQYFTHKGKDTDLFVDVHPPKGFRHMSAIKYYQPAQQTLGSLVCQIYSGTFAKQVSKNILVVGAPGSGKSLLVQALAGETELKIIIDNAHRYSLVQRGVAVGMKLLRDVFDAIALHTPCLFLMEDIHVIGERRPMLISDDENAKATESFFSSENEEVHEKNQLIYQLTKHAISHYKKPYKGDFSLLIPTNHFCFDLFLGVSPPKTRKLGITPKSPLDVESIESELTKSQNEAVSEQSFTNSSISKNKRFPFDTLVSHLQIPSQKYFAPPPTSPFTILMMKEQKKLVPKKLVKQIPWSGLSWDQMMLVSKVNYSIRVKVTLLAEIAISNLAVKLDMITDLLVIMDSVRSNRGFVVFATTHIPFILDPALRRPGRLDETISLPSLPNLVNRWEIFKTNLSHFTETLDFVDYSLLSANLTDTQISTFISKTKLLLFNTTVEISSRNNLAHMKMAVKTQFNIADVLARRQFYPSLTLNKLPAYSIRSDRSRDDVLSHAKKQTQKYDDDKNSRFYWASVFDFVLKSNQQQHTRSSRDHRFFPIQSVNQAAKITMNADLIEPSQITNRIQKALTKVHDKKIRARSNTKRVLGTKQNSSSTRSNERQRFIYLDKLLKNFDVYPSIPGGSSNLISSTYFQMGRFLINSQLVFDQTSYGLITWSKFLVSHNLEEHVFRDLYSARSDFKNTLMRLFSGKVGEFFVFNNSSLCRYFLKATSRSSQDFAPSDRGFSSNKNAITHTNENHKYIKLNTRTDVADALESGFQHSGFWNSVGIHPFWNSANTFVCSLIQKRYLYNKNLLISRMLYFEDLSSLREPPSPPNSSILLPAKRYENLKRTENDFQQKATLSIHEKIQLHQQQRLMKKLYNRPINEYFRSEMVENRLTKFSSSIKELGYLNSFIRRPSSVNCYYKNRICFRHKFSLLNQWWNGQLAEHNAETIFLSDVDWRSIFNKSLGDLFIDFPDADQHYNPRRRRWFLQDSYWGYWNTFDKTITQEISYHFMIQCFNEAYNFLNNEREILDYLAHSFLQKGLLNEIHLVATKSRFYNSPTSR